MRNVEQRSFQEDIRFQLMRDELQALLRVLTARERSVVEARFKEGLTLVETGRLLDLGSKHNVRRVEAQAMRRMLIT